MPTFTISGEFWAADEDDALLFLARYLAAARDNPSASIPVYDHMGGLIKVAEVERVG